jgi:hypothetical protein
MYRCNTDTNTHHRDTILLLPHLHGVVDRLFDRCVTVVLCPVPGKEGQRMRKEDEERGRRTKKEAEGVRKKNTEEGGGGVTS